MCKAFDYYNAFPWTWTNHSSFFLKVFASIQAILFCSLHVNFQSGIEEKTIYDHQNQARKLILHAHAWWSQARYILLQPHAFRTACPVSNLILLNSIGKFQLEKLSHVQVSPLLISMHLGAQYAHYILPWLQERVFLNGIHLQDWESNLGLHLDMHLSWLSY